MSISSLRQQQHQSIELSELADMDRRDRFREDQASEPLLNHDEQDGDIQESSSNGHDPSKAEEVETPFSWVAYSIFVLLGIAMLWAWNMFLAAAPYFQRRFRNDDWILNHFQPAEISVATVTNLVFITILSNLQKNASYPRRIVMSLLLNMVLNTILAVSTYMKADARLYFGFLLVVIFFSMISAALMGNGIFSFTVGFGRKEYTQAIMTGQGIAGVLPPLVQIISVAAVPAGNTGSEETTQSPKSAFVYFITATAVSGVTLVAFLELLRRKARSEAINAATRHSMVETPEQQVLTESGILRASVPLTRLFMKIPYLVLSVILCFSVTMVSFPVFTSVILSNSGIDPAMFIPLGFLLWNIGDFLGRLMTAIPQVLLTHHPFALFCLAMARLLFIPMYFLCNIKGNGAVINSDFFYLIIVQLLFGLSNGYLGSNCMMGAGDWVAPDEREAVGGFMALCLIIGLTIGSLLSFTLGNV